MGLWGWMTGLVTGVDLDAEKARAETLDKKIAEQNADLLARDIWDEEQYRQAEANRQANLAESQTYYSDVGDAFVTGAKEGLAAEAGYVKDTINTVGGGTLAWIWKAVPWWVWILGLAYVGWQLGAFKRLR